MLILLLGASLGAQKAAHGPTDALRADVQVILVPVTVIDRRGAAVNGLAQDDFTVLEDKIPQKIVSFNTGDSPCSVGLVLDLSGSMRDVLQPAKDALGGFLREANPEDEFMLLGVSTKPLLYPLESPENPERLTSDTAAIQNRVQVASVGGSTALVDTIYTALVKMRGARNSRRALMIVSDGMDNHSRHTKQELMRLAAEADVQMYTIAIDNVPREKKYPEQLEARRGLNYLEELADRTGGLYFICQNQQDVRVAVERAGIAIRNQYVIGYRPRKVDPNGKWRRVKVKLDRDQVQVYARTGYYAR